MTVKDKIRHIEPRSLPASYSHLLLKEGVLLEYVLNFKRQFEQVYPQRPPLLLTVKNECDTAKFISTFIRPTELPYTEFYDLAAASSYVAKYIMYHPLAHPLLLPEYVMSPTTTLSEQHGDCFEMSLLLVSLLIGAGYDAYCVCGYAAQEVAENNQTLRPSAELKGSITDDEDNVEWTPDEDPLFTLKPVSGNVHIVDDRRSERKSRLESKFLKSKAQGTYEIKDPSNEADKKEADTEANDGDQRHWLKELDEAAQIDDSYLGKRVHCWVLVLPGKRDIPEPLYVEPSSGEVLRLSLNSTANGWTTNLRVAHEYYSIEALWNHENYFVNMQSTSVEALQSNFRYVYFQKHKARRSQQFPRDLDAPEPVAASISFDLGDLRRWEYLFFEGTELDINHHLQGKENRLGQVGRTPSQSKAAVAEQQEGDGGEQETAEAEVKPEKLLIEKARELSALTTSDIADVLSAELKFTSLENFETIQPRQESNNMQSGNMGAQSLVLPPSWVAPLSLTREEYERRYPDGGARRLCYKDATVYVYADYSRPDGMTLRIFRYCGSGTRDSRGKSMKSYLYHDACDFEIPNGESVSEERQYFRHRKDRLECRIVREDGDAVTELFGPGRRRDANMEGLCRFTFVKKQRRVFVFYDSARLDGLKKREEIYARCENGIDHGVIKVRQFFRGRADGLIYRSITYTEPYRVDRVIEEHLRQDKLSGSHITINNPSVAKMAEKFAVPAEIGDRSVAKRTFYVERNLIQVQFHYVPGRVTQRTRMYPKVSAATVGGFGNGVQHEEIADYVTNPMRTSELSEELTELMHAERQCLTACKESEREAREILVQRHREEDNVQFFVSVYDTVRNAAPDEEELSRQRGKEKDDSVDRRDYLTPFLPQNQRIESKTQALAVKNSCLKALKDRFVQRANIMQQRLDDERTSLARKQAQYQRGQDHMNKQDEEDYVLYCDGAMFRIHILRQRLNQLSDQSMHKFTQLDARLNSDSRLAPWLNPNVPF